MFRGQEAPGLTSVSSENFWWFAMCCFTTLSLCFLICRTGTILHPAFLTGWLEGPGWGNEREITF